MLVLILLLAVGFKFSCAWWTEKVKKPQWAISAIHNRKPVWQSPLLFQFPPFVFSFNKLLQTHMSVVNIYNYNNQPNYM